MSRPLPTSSPLPTSLAQLLQVSTLSCEDERVRCGICLEAYRNTTGDGNATPPTEKPVELPCGHLFGSACIDRWLNDGNNTCPTCRHEILDLTGHAPLWIGHGLPQRSEEELPRLNLVPLQDSLDALHTAMQAMEDCMRTLEVSRAQSSSSVDRSYWEETLRMPPRDFRTANNREIAGIRGSGHGRCCWG